MAPTNTSPTSISRTIPVNELNLDTVLTSGQTFRWQRDDSGWWCSVVAERSALRVFRQEDVVHCEAIGAEAEIVLSEYFRLGHSLVDIRDFWNEAGERDLVKIVDSRPGLRIVRQDPMECLFGFICSSAAPIHRIRRSVTGLCSQYGSRFGDWNGVPLVSFPLVEVLATADRSDLDRLGLGFRGRYVIDAAKQIIQRGGKEWLNGLREESYVFAKAALMDLPGIGEKVADCICLFSLDKDEAVPIDVHMDRVSRRLFPEYATTSSLTPKSYSIAAESFRNRYGAYSGWAQQYFFYGEIARRGVWDQIKSKHGPKQSD